jgi:hypothetical protein
VDVRIFLEVDHITLKKSEGPAGHLCKRSIAKILFYMANQFQQMMMLELLFGGF